MDWTEIVALENPVKEGYTFSGWSEVPATMPAEAVNIYGTWNVNGVYGIGVLGTLTVNGGTVTATGDGIYSTYSTITINSYIALSKPQTQANL
mgnify:CR=1 FL=1